MERSERHLRRVLSSLVWLTYALGVFLSFFSQGMTSTAIIAAVLAGIYVVGQQILPFPAVRRPWVQDLATTIGILLTMSSVALTGGENSPYVLLSLMPVLLAAILGGFRRGLAAAALGTAALAIVSFETPPFDVSGFVQWAALIVLLAIAAAQSRRLLLESRVRAEQLEATSASAAARLARLHRANSLLARFVEEADSAELNPVTVADTALRELEAIIPFDAALVALAGEDGPVVVSRKGSNPDRSRQTTLPLTVGERQVGFVAVTTPEQIEPDVLVWADEVLQPLALAFANILLLQDIAKRAVREERRRLARDLHDEIGPSLASLGLAVDLALLRHPSDPDLAEHLRSLRDSVSGLVDDVRSTVADLRMNPQPSVSEVVRRIAGTVGDMDPVIDLRLREQRPPRPSLAPDIIAIVTEAIRNALNHAQAKTITVYGNCDYDEGRISVFDDGHGFSRAGVPQGRYGLVGMEERARKINAALDVTSTPKGTTVTVAWGPT